MSLNVELINFTDLSKDEKEMILAWRNHSDVKRWMYNTEDILLENHLSFIETLLNKKDKLYFLVKSDEKYIGVIDFTNITTIDCEFGLYANITLKGINHKLDSEEMEALFKSADLVLDCTDNFETRFAINKASVASKTPLVSAAAIRFEGQITCFIPNDPKSPCYRCLYDDNSNDEAELCSENGVLAPVVGILGAMQALEAIKMLCHVGESLTNRLMLLDAMTMEWQSIKTKPDPQCPVCGTP